MPTPPLSDEKALEAVEALRRYGRNHLAARALDLNEKTFRHRVGIAKQRGLGGFPKAPPGQALAGSSTLYKFPEDDPEGRLLQWVKAKEEAQSTADLVAAIKDEFEQYDGFAKLVPPPKETEADLCNFYPIVDPHIGMLSYGKETGESNDLKIGVARVQNTLQRLIGLSPPAETGVIINTGDFFHADDQRNVTPASGHQLDVDGRNQKVKWAGVNLMRTSIDYALQRHKRVIVKNLKGNHDPESAMWLNIALGLFYSSEPRVEIDIEGNNDHFFHLFGVNYTAATHGHTMKPDRMYIMMAEDNPEYWNASLYRWCIFGHIHHETVKTVGSVRCESFSQPVPKDSFAHSHGYRAASSMQSVTLHRDGGEIGRNKQNFPPSRGRPIEQPSNRGNAMRRPRPPFRRVRKGRRYLPNTGTEDEEAAFDLPELEDWMTGAPGGK